MALEPRFWLEWGAVLFNVIYVILAARRSIWCWPFGIIGVLLAFLVYIQVRLYSDASLQVAYLLLSGYGWYTWRKNQRDASLSIRRMPMQLHAKVILSGLVGGLLLGWFWQFFDAALPFIDGLTTSFSLVTTWLVARRYVENWLYWIVIDLVCIGVYLERDIPAFVWLFVLYTVLAFWGWRRWIKTSSSDEPSAEQDLI